MAGHYWSRPTTSTITSNNNNNNNTCSHVLFLLTILPLSLACFAFILQWRGGLTDPTIRWGAPLDNTHQVFPGMEDSTLTTKPKSSGSGCLLSRSRSASFPYFKDWNFDFQSDLKPQICIQTSTSAGLEQILPWIYYHKVIGVSTFFLFVEGKAASANVSRVLESIPGVKVVYRTKELEEQQAKSRIWSESWLSSFFYKPCNYELFVKQSLNMEMAIVMAREAGMDWILHLDTDELIYPAGTREYSLRQLLSDIPSDTDMESSVERDDIKEPFSEVSMFKKNYDHLPKDVYFGSYKEATRGNPNYFLTYGNGKSVARVQDHLRPNGAHRWHNYMKRPSELKLDEAAVLHYTYPKFSDLTSRRNRCGCKPTKDDVKRCFMLEFDRAAFIIASTATEEEMLQWYRERVVWTDTELTLKLLRKGILTRIYTPMAIVQGLRESGVFTSVIESALASNDNLSKSKDNSSATVKSEIHSRKIITDEKSNSTARRILEFSDNTSHSSAIPPLSPPSPDDQFTATDNITTILNLPFNKIVDMSG
ncbi:hypothetical protein ACFE04_013152 [Oxalis oulophora]